MPSYCMHYFKKYSTIYMHARGGGARVDLRRRVRACAYMRACVERRSAQRCIISCIISITPREGAPVSPGSSSSSSSPAGCGSRCGRTYSKSVRCVQTLRGCSGDRRPTGAPPRRSRRHSPTILDSPACRRWGQGCCCCCCCCCASCAARVLQRQKTSANRTIRRRRGWTTDRSIISWGRSTHWHISGPISHAA
eukprot:SAG31_NODE_5024_length_2798_cov_8.965543_2_plen_194_part_00